MKQVFVRGLGGETSTLNLGEDDQLFQTFTVYELKKKLHEKCPEIGL